MAAHETRVLFENLDGKIGAVHEDGLLVIRNSNNFRSETSDNFAKLERRI